VVRALWRGDFTVEVALPTALGGVTDLEDVTAEDVLGLVWGVVAARCGPHVAGDPRALLVTAGGCILDARASVAGCLSTSHGGGLETGGSLSLSDRDMPATSAVLRIGIEARPTAPCEASLSPASAH
jgi:hypothetical protein